MGYFCNFGVEFNESNMYRCSFYMPQQNSLPALLCFGDSITANGRWLTAPETTSSWRLFNAGRCGRKTSDIPTELPTALTAHPEATG
ncbi:MAG: hypothetical protein EA353_14485, partial [Puniceicoccaceae bacterium]